MQESRQVRRAQERALDKQNKRAQRYNVAYCDPRDIRTLQEWRQEDPIYAGYLERALDHNQPFFISQSSLKNLEPDFLVQWCLDNASPGNIMMSAADVQISKNLHEIYEDCEFSTPIHKDHHVLVPVFDAEQFSMVDPKGKRVALLEHAEASYFNSYGAYRAFTSKGQAIVDSNLMVNSLFLRVNDPSLINPLTFCTTVAHEMTHLDEFMGMSRAEVKRDYKKAGDTRTWIAKILDTNSKKLDALGDRYQARVGAAFQGLMMNRGHHGQHHHTHSTPAECRALGEISQQNLGAIQEQRAERAVAKRWSDHLGETEWSMAMILQSTMEDIRSNRATAKPLWDQFVGQLSPAQRHYVKLLGMWDSQGGMTAREILQQEVIPQHQLMTFAWKSQQLRQQYKQYQQQHTTAQQDLLTA